MERALYQADSGYYRQSPQNIIGKGGDFFTASQLQPVFGELISALLPGDPVLELGPGNGEMCAALAPRHYRSVSLGEDLPASWRGTVFANEFFDALPVTAGVRRGSSLRELLVQRTGSTFRWQDGPELSPERTRYVHCYYPQLPDGARFEIAERAVDWIRRISKCLTAGRLLIVDYGWSGSEYRRFPAGTLMSYRRHAAFEDVLTEPGKRDITAHVPFSALMDAARECGFTSLRLETLSQTLLRALECAPHLLMNKQRAGQLKALLFGMGESFRTLTLVKEPAK